jgi:hypothetical protein
MQFGEISGSHRGEYEDDCSEALTAFIIYIPFLHISETRGSNIVWEKLYSQSSPVKYTTNFSSLINT